MSTEAPNLILTTSPFLKRPVETPSVMRHVIYSLIPAILASVYFFGLSALLIIVACVAGCVAAEWTFGRGKRTTISDGRVGFQMGMILLNPLPVLTLDAKLIPTFRRMADLSFECRPAFQSGHGPQPGV